MPPNVANLFGFMATQMVAQMAPSACAQTGRTWHQQGGRSWCDSRRFAALPRHVEAPPAIEPLAEPKIVQTVPVVPEPPAVQPEPRLSLLPLHHHRHMPRNYPIAITGVGRKLWPGLPEPSRFSTPGTCALTSPRT
jgi:hypothetical protein